MLSYSDFKRYSTADIDQLTYDRYAWRAEKVLSDATRCVNFDKLRFAYPTEARDAEAIERCEVAIIEMLYNTDTYEAMAASGQIVTSRSAGNESISYARVGYAAETAGNKQAQNKMLYDTVREYLTGVKDANGVNMLYTGPYPV